MRASRASMLPLLALLTRLKLGTRRLSAWELLIYFHSHSVNVRDVPLNCHLAQKTIDGICQWTLPDGIEFRWLCQPD